MLTALSYLQISSSLHAQSQTYSVYKSNNTAKALVGIAPSGFVTFVSSLYVEHISDMKITQECGLINLLEPGNMVMAGRCFGLQHLSLGRTAVYIIKSF